MPSSDRNAVRPSRALNPSLGGRVAIGRRDHPFLKPTAAIFLKFFQISDFWHFIKLAITNEDGMLRIISLGAGVQSTTMGPMAAHGAAARNCKSILIFQMCLADVVLAAAH